MMYFECKFKFNQSFTAQNRQFSSLAIQIYLIKILIKSVLFNITFIFNVNSVNFHNYGVVILLTMLVKHCCVGLLSDDNTSIYSLVVTYGSGAAGREEDQIM